MLSRCVSMIRSFAPSVTAFASSRPDPTVKYEFRPADQRDKGKIMDLALNDFIYTEPHAVALGMTKDSAKELVDYVVSKSLHYSFGYTTIGFRLMSVAHKDQAKDFEPYEIDLAKCGEAEEIFMSLTESLKDEAWKQHPEAEKVLRRELTFVLPEHQRHGIAQYLLHLGLDFEKLKADGIDGLESAASSKANQTLLAKNGYQMLMESQRKAYTFKNGQPINFPDDTKTSQLYYLPLR